MTLTWLAPAAWWLATLVAVPVAVHLLARQRHQSLRFPTVRFLDDAAAPARRRWTPRDPWLLAVRLVIVLAVTAALAAPLLVTPARQARWDAPLAQAIVVTPAAADGAHVPTATGAGDQRRFVTADLRGGLADAAAWLAVHRFSRREIVVVAPLARDAVDVADVKALPADLGVRFVRTPAPSSTPATRVRAELVDDTLWRITETVTLDDTGTTVRETARVASSARVIEPVAPVEARAAAEAARRAVLRRGVLVTGDAPIAVPWTGDIAAFAAAIDAQAGEGSGTDPAPIAEATLSAMTRPPRPRGPSAPVDEGDRRAVWLAVLALLGLETWLRSRPA